MDVAIGQHQRSESVWVVGGEDLRDRAAAVVGDEIDPIDAERVEDLGDHLRLRRERDVLRRSDFGVTEPHQVDGDATPPMPDTRR